MNKLILFFLFVTGNMFAQSFSRYFCNYTASPVVVDGKAESAWNEAIFSSAFVDILSDSIKPPLNTTFKMLWDSTNLYLFATLEEPDVSGFLTNHDDIIYRDNDFELFIDPDGDGLNYYEIEVNSLNILLDLFLKKPYNKGGTADLSWDAKNIRSAVRIAGTLNNPEDKDSCWSVEMAIPWTSLNQTSPPVNSIWRMNFSRVEWDYQTETGEYVKQKGTDGKPLPEHNWVWSAQGKVNMHIPERWGFIHFVQQEIPRFWVWMGAYTSWSNQQWDSAFVSLQSVGITGVLMSANKEVLEKVIPIAAMHGIQVHAWFWTMNRGEAKPEWLSVNQLGESLASKKAYVDYYKFMCPALPAVKTFLKGKIEELATVKGLSGIHFDYIRYVDVILPEGLQPKYHLVQKDIMPEYDYGYHPYMRKRYAEKYGMDPLQLSDLSHDSTWLWFRLNELDSTVALLRHQVKSRGLISSSAVFPTPDMSRRMVRQDWNSWQLDYYFPMVYHNFYNQPISWIKEVIRQDKASVSAATKVFCGLYVPALKNNDDLTKAIDAVYQGGADGVAFFDYNSLDRSCLQQIRAAAVERGIIKE